MPVCSRGNVDLLRLLASIVTDVILPILMMVGVGALVRWKFKLDMATLSKLNLWIFSPAFIFDKVAHSTLPWSAMGGVVLITVVQVVMLGVVVLAVGRIFGVARTTVTALALGTMFYNSGNYGIPLAELAFPKDVVGGVKDGSAIQAFVVMCQNFLVFTVGMFVASRDKPGQTFFGSFRAIFTLPAVPVLLAALLCRMYLQADPGNHLPVMIDKSVKYLSLGLVPISLVTLGAQLAGNFRWPRWKPVATVCCLRLLLGPIQMAGMLWVFHATGLFSLWPWPAELLIVTAAVPSAVNTLLLTLETGGDSELAADCVFWTTVISPFTLGLTILVTRLWFG
jgi:malate permease and related proteins